MEDKKASSFGPKPMMILYLVFLLLMSLALAAMPFSSVYKDITGVPLIITGASFWTGLAGTVVMAIMINLSRKRCEAFEKEYPELTQVGLISFFKNKPAIVADVAMMVAFVATLLSLICFKNVFAFFICVAVFVFSLGSHCMLNGKNFIYIKYSQER